MKIPLGLWEGSTENATLVGMLLADEGMDDTLTLMRLGITGQLAKTLCSTNRRESMIEIVRYMQRNVKRWQGGDMPTLDRRRDARRRTAIRGRKTPHTEVVPGT